MNTFFLSSVLALSIFILGCATSNHSAAVVKKNDIKLDVFLVAETLKKTNSAFRKVNRFTPIVYNDHLITANSIDGLVSYNLKTKSIDWRFYIKHGVEAAGFSAGGTLFVGGLDGNFYSIELDDGKLNWKFDTKTEIVSEPTLQKGIIYFLNGANALFSLDAASGKQLWVYNRQETSTQMTVRGGSRPLIDNGVLYIGFSDGALVAINAATGTPQWEVLLNKNSRFKDIDASPVIENDRIYINSYDDKLYCLSKNNGSVLWKSDFGGATAPMISGDKIIYSTAKNHIQSVSKKDGSVLWTVKNIAGIATEPSLFKGYVVIGESQGSIKFFDLLDGSLKTSFEPGRGVMSKPAFDKDENFYFISGEANVYGIKIKSLNKSAIPYLVQ